MKVLITGSKGFIGKNLISHLQEEENIEIITYDINDDFYILIIPLQCIPLYIFYLFLISP